MSEPISWLPPLNSHDNFTFDIVLTNDAEIGAPVSPDIEWKDFIFIHVKTYIIFNREKPYKNKDKEKKDYIFGLHMWNDIKIPATTSSFGIRDEISKVLANKELVPFELPLELKGCEYGEWRVDERPRRQIVQLTFFKIDDLIDHITNYLIALLHDTLSSNASVPHRSYLGIDKNIVVPVDEFDSWRAWMDEQSKRHPRIFDSAYFEAISRPRTGRELAQEAMMRSMNKSTGKSAIDALEDMVVDLEL